MNLSIAWPVTATMMTHQVSWIWRLFDTLV